MERDDRVGGLTRESLLHNKDEFSRRSVLEAQPIAAFLLSRPLVNIFTAPLARISILFQVQGMYSNFGVLGKPPPSILREFSRIVAEEGFKSLWKGNSASIARAPPCFAISMLMSDTLDGYLESVFGFGPPPENILLSATEACLYVTVAVISSAIADSAVYPMDLVRTRLAAERSRMYYNGIWHAFRTIYQEEGFLGLYKGYGASILKEAPRIAINVTSYELIKSAWKSRRPNDSVFYTSVAAVGVSGVLSSMGVLALKGIGAAAAALSQIFNPNNKRHSCGGGIKVTFPVDVVRKRLQLDGAGGKAKIYNTGLSGIFTHIIKKDGMRGLYRGILPNFLMVFPRMGLYLMTYEMIKRRKWFIYQ